jgi:predicted anti-sigma-YlaC factor YlaD
MNITRNVVADLLPVYLSGEASPDTSALIEEFLRQDAELSRVVEAQRREFSSQPQFLEPAGARSGDHELRTLSRARSLMERQKWSLALALTLTAFPLSFVFSGSHVTFMLVRDQPVLAVASLCGAAMLWMQYFITRRRLRVTALLGRGQGRDKP